MTINVELLDRIIEALESPMPDDFKWSFQDIYYAPAGTACGCAVGLAYHIGIIPSARLIFASFEFCPASVKANVRDELYELFLPSAYLPAEVVTPLMVAEKLKEWRAKYVL